MGTSKSILVEQLEQLSVPVLIEHGMELVDLQFVHEHGQWILRYLLDKPGGITLDDCSTLSEHLGRILDATDLISQAYSLEVSSPGLNRPLRKEKDFERFIGERVDVTLYAPLNGRRHFRGVLHSFKEGVIQIEEPSHEVFTMPLSVVSKAKLDPDITI